MASGSRARIPLPRCLLWMIAKGGVLLSQVHHTLWPHSLAHSQAPQVGGSWRHMLFIVASSHTGQTSSKWKSTGQSKAALAYAIRIDLNFRDHVAGAVLRVCVPISRVEGREEERSVASSSLGWMSLLLEGAACLWQALHNRQA